MFVHLLAVACALLWLNVLNLVCPRDQAQLVETVWSNESKTPCILD